MLYAVCAHRLLFIALFLHQQIIPLCLRGDISARRGTAFKRMTYLDPSPLAIATSKSRLAMCLSGSYLQLSLFVVHSDQDRNRMMLSCKVFRIRSFSAVSAMSQPGALKHHLICTIRASQRNRFIHTGHGSPFEKDKVCSDF
jgi:hypothetical protein